jgi:hypothetical protein
MPRIKRKVDGHFKEYCKREIRHGDAMTLSKLLEVSYPTILKYLTGNGTGLQRKEAIIRFFETRKKHEADMIKRVRDVVQNS